MYQLDAPTYWYFLLLIPLLWTGYVLVGIWKRRSQQHFAQPQMLEQLSPMRSRFKPLLKTLLLSLAFLMLIIALVNPKIGTELETVKREGVDIVFAMDVSKSMLAEDVAPNRLEKSKRLVSAILDQLTSDRVGIIAYAAQAVPQLPITTDYGAARLFLQGLNTEMLSSQGTAIDVALNLATTYFNDAEQTNRVVFLISDGEDHSEAGKAAAREAAAEGIKVFTFGVGSDAGGPIPIKRNGVIETYKKDPDGEVVITQRNMEVLTEIALETGGAYIDGNSTQEVVDFVAQTLKDMDKKEFDAKEFVSYKDQFQAFLFVGFLLFLIEIVVFETKTKWIARLNLFNESKK